MITSKAMAARRWIPVLLLAVAVASCSRRQPPVARPTPPPPPAATASVPPSPPQPVREPTVVPPQPLTEDPVAARSLDDLNRDSPFMPAYFGYDSDEINEAARAVLQANAAVMRKYPAWTITIPWSRSTPEYTSRELPMYARCRWPPRMR